MGSSRASSPALRPLALAVAVLLAAGGAWGQTTWTKYEFNPVLERGALKTGQHYGARLRLRLDISLLPKPLSIGAVTSDKWELATPWFEWSFDAPAVPPASSPLP